jgi:hypothetical protein
VGLTTGLAGCFGGGGGGDTNTETIGGQSTPTGTPLPDAAQLALESIDAPSEAEIQSEYTFTINVSTGGGQPGVYRAPVNVRRGGGVSYQEVNDALVYVAPGETQAADISIPPFQFTGAANIQVEGAQNQWRIQINGRELPFGGTFATAEGMVMSITRIELRDSYVYNGPGGEQEIEATEGNQYAFVYIDVSNETGREEFTPRPADFRVLYGGSELTTELVNREEGQYRESRIQAGATTSGWMPFLVPSEATVEDLNVKFDSGSGTRNQIAYWRRSNEADDGGQESGSSTATPTGTPQS